MIEARNPPLSITHSHPHSSLSSRELQTGLMVFPANPGVYYVPSDSRKFCYRVDTSGPLTCSCEEYEEKKSRHPLYICPHIDAVLHFEQQSKTQGASKIMTDSSIHNGNKPKLDERFIKNIQGREFVVYAGLLDLAHQYGLRKLEVEHVQIPCKENGNVAICRAVASTQDGAVFTDVGDANPSNVNRMIAPHVLRMASTRAKARVLRDLCNIGITCLEELAELDEVLGDSPNGSRGMKSHAKRESAEPGHGKTSSKAQDTKIPDSKTPSTKTNGSSAKTEGTPSTPESSSEIPTLMSEAQRRAIVNLARRRGISEEALNALAVETHGLPLEEFSPKDASGFIRTLQQTA